MSYVAKWIVFVGRRPLKKEETKVTDADTAEIKAWHEAVLSCQTASQLAVCMNLLDKKIIAWEKSTTKEFWSMQKGQVCNYIFGLCVYVYSS